jgi:hypothetical protein
MVILNNNDAEQTIDVKHFAESLNGFQKGKTSFPAKNFR